MKRIRYWIFTLLVMGGNLGLSYLLSHSMEIRLLDAMFYVGAITTVIFIFFSSSGGFLSTRNEAHIATSIEGSKSNYQMQHSSFSLRVNPLVLGSVLFLFLGFILAFFV
ncbi:hypothetical protein [Bacillus pinisoli]|uniref:hypothetical protein n=1 Tax=Bacillus pinisoli TaxID=2901866 RepID=UPI001FF10748|nr:hypothetical protein [Bacillus pinisoli]